MPKNNITALSVQALNLPEHIKPVYANPTDIILRQQLKHELVTALSQGDDPFQQAGVDGGAFWVFGSSVMNLHWHEGTRFPIHAKKSMDLDLGIHVPGGKVPTAKQPALMAAANTVFRKAMAEVGGATYRRDGTQDPNQPLVGGGDYILAKHYTQDDARYYLRHFKDLADSIPPEGYDVALDLSCALKEPPMLLPPTEFPRLRDGSCPIHVDDTRNFLAKKLARASLPGDFRYQKDPTGFKPRDILDIYNVANADPPMLDLEPGSPTSDLPLIRTLLIANLCAMGKDVNQVNVAAFQPDPEKMQHYREEIDKICMPSSRFENSHMLEMFDGIETLLCKLFPERNVTVEGGARKESLILTEDEQKFVDGIRGYEMLPGGHGTRQVNAMVRPELLLKNDYFQQPENQTTRDYLKQAIQRNDGLVERVEKIQNARSGASY